MKEITEDYVSFETAKLLEEKGFDEKCFQYWHEKDNELVHSRSVHPIRNITNPCFFGPAAPTLQMAMKWLREVHNFHITAFPAWDNDDGTKMSFEKWGESIDGLDGEYCMPISGPVYYNSYEEAC